MLGRLSPAGRFFSVFTLTVDAAGKHLLAYGDAHRLQTMNPTAGQQASVSAARIPCLDAACNTAAW